MREAQAHVKALPGIPSYRSLDECLSQAYRVRAQLGVKTATYKESTAPDTSKAGLTLHERKAEAVMMFHVIEQSLNSQQRAWIDAIYDGAGPAREAAIETLCAALANLTRTPALLRYALMRDVVLGEARCPSQDAIADELGVDRVTVYRVSQRVMTAMQEIGRMTGERLRPAFEARGWLASKIE